jgi:hypothetical protein
VTTSLIVAVLGIDLFFFSLSRISGGVFVVVTIFCLFVRDHYYVGKLMVFLKAMNAK